ncbi:MAG: 50S ribosomal protein L22 [Puniceicoccales bacterium]|jgi:large subunit ribosomal protein L22|nr:50S ribosomal protein L22 [Puniceicoccales bacterium]
MEFQAITKSARMTPQKVREVARQIQGLPATQAADALRFIPRKSARLLAKTLKSAIANAENNPENSISANDLYVASIRVDQGPVLKRHRPSAKGSAHPIRKSTAHIRVVLDQTVTKEKTEN